MASPNIEGGDSPAPRTPGTVAAVGVTPKPTKSKDPRPRVQLESLVEKAVAARQDAPHNTFLLELAESQKHDLITYGITQSLQNEMNRKLNAFFAEHPKLSAAGQVLRESHAGRVEEFNVNFRRCLLESRRFTFTDAMGNLYDINAEMLWYFIRHSMGPYGMFGTLVQVPDWIRSSADIIQRHLKADYKIDVSSAQLHARVRRVWEAMDPKSNPDEPASTPARQKARKVHRTSAGQVAAEIMRE